MKIIKAYIKELIEELTELDKNIPIEKDGIFETTISFKPLIRKVNNLNHALNPKYKTLPSFDRFDWEVQGLYDKVYKWEMVTTESTKSEALKRLKEYRENEKGVMFRIRKVKEE